jgi:hypothetical protein
LISGEASEGGNGLIFLQKRPQTFGAQARERVLDMDRTSQTLDVGGGVTPLDALPARLVLPAMLQIRCGGRDLHAELLSPKSLWLAAVATLDRSNWMVAFEPLDEVR